MKKYYCTNCKKEIEDRFRDSQKNTCLLCGSEKLLKVKSEIFWDKNLNVPLLQPKNHHENRNSLVVSDLRPVFNEEKILLEHLLKNRIQLLGKSVWHSNSGYIVDGKRVRISKVEMMKASIVDARSFVNNYKIDSIYKNQEKKMLSDFVKINSEYLESLTWEAFEYISTFKDDYGLDEMFISFSGGKDSTVVTNLVERSFSSKAIRKIFGDTTIEYPKTYEYVKRFNKSNVALIAKNKDDDFYEISEKIGPPSQNIRWCCTFFKTTPIADKVARLYGDKKRIISFQGVRRSESNARSKYLRTSVISKIKKQTTASPIIDWLDIDVWLYILGNNLDFNHAYRDGFARVGCWLCPNNSNWEIFLSRIYQPREADKWDQQLYDFSERIGKNNIEDYVMNNRWQTRFGGEGLKISQNTFLNIQKDIEKRTIAYDFSNREYSENIIELFKPFGDVEILNDSQQLVEFVVAEKGTVSIRASVDKINRKMKVYVEDYKKFGGISKKISNTQMAMLKIENQLNKFQLCVGCNGCKSVCKYDAIRITKNEKADIRERVTYVINSDKCVRCGECIDYFEGGCYMKKVLRVKGGDDVGK